MKKIEIIWREILFESIEKGKRDFTQKDLAAKFNFSTSTVFQALRLLREMGAVKVTARNFYLEDPEKALYHWASMRRLSREILASFHLEMTVSEIEGLAPPDCIFGGYKAALTYLNFAPADYDKIYLYTDNLASIFARYKIDHGRPNLFIIKKDPFMSLYGEATTISQTFVDIWNLEDWYAKEFTNALKEKINELLP